MKSKAFFITIGQPNSVCFLFFLMAGFFLASCEQQSQSNLPIKRAVKKFEVATSLEGAVTDDRGPIKAGTVTALDSSGQVIARTQLGNSDHYRIEIPASTILPIVLSFHPEGQSQDTQEFIAAVVHPNLTKYDINPLSTAIAKKAQELGGYTHANLVRAAESMGTVPDANKMTEGFRGDPTKQYGGWH